MQSRVETLLLKQMQMMLMTINIMKHLRQQRFDAIWLLIGLCGLSTTFAYFIDYTGGCTSFKIIILQMEFLK